MHGSGFQPSALYESRPLVQVLPRFLRVKALGACTSSHLRRNVEIMQCCFPEPGPTPKSIISSNSSISFNTAACNNM